MNTSQANHGGGRPHAQSELNSTAQISRDTSARSSAINREACLLNRGLTGDASQLHRLISSLGNNRTAVILVWSAVQQPTLFQAIKLHSSLMFLVLHLQLGESEGRVGWLELLNENT